MKQNRFGFMTTTLEKTFTKAISGYGVVIFMVIGIFLQDIKLIIKTRQFQVAARLSLAARKTTP